MAGFLTFTQSFDRPARFGRSARFETPSEAKLASLAEEIRCLISPCLKGATKMPSGRPRYSEDKGPTIILESRYGDLGELQCMATLLDALGMPRLRMVARPGHAPVPCQLFARLYARRVARLLGAA